MFNNCRAITFISIMILISLLTDFNAQNKQKKKEKKDKSVKSEVPENKGEFNKLQEMGGSRRNSYRDDYIWGINTAFPTPKSAKDISLVNSSRFGVSDNIELSSNILMNLLAPNLFLKYNYKKEKLWISSRHGLYSATMGMERLSEFDYVQKIDTTEKIPFSITLRNEIILSYPIFNNLDCGSRQPYLIFSLVGGVDYGYSFDNWSGALLNNSYLEPRTAALLGDGFMLRILGRVDYLPTQRWKIEGEIAAINDNLTSIWGFEGKGVAKYFLFLNLSTSLGFMASYSTGVSSPPFTILPMIDFTYYIGTRQNRERGLWNKKMF